MPTVKSVPRIFPGVQPGEEPKKVRMLPDVDRIWRILSLYASFEMVQSGNASCGGDDVAVCKGSAKKGPFSDGSGKSPGRHPGRFSFFAFRINLCLRRGAQPVGFPLFFGPKKKQSPSALMLKAKRRRIGPSLRSGRLI
ncbi:hypothetical protein [Rhizobium paknamense]|uniref:Uncharacterized protein n=1 Tax=Rhizobium paknamense TaxID=1206817 RepID=A0ABU0I997_9HYPH|nr:hypothetical protein [Rhizobium paknamense]MDQ0454814.1 hypothetical protein [Rhizobium paknamense]